MYVLIVLYTQHCTMYVHVTVSFYTCPIVHACMLTLKQILRFNYDQCLIKICNKNGEFSEL